MEVLIKHTVASDNEKLIIGVDLVYLDVRECSDDLLLRGEIGALLELEVAYRAGQGEVAVDAAEVDEASSSLDTCLLSCGMSARLLRGRHGTLTLVLGLVVEREGLCTAFYTKDCARVTGVGLDVSDCRHKYLKDHAGPLTT